MQLTYITDNTNLRDDIETKHKKILEQNIVIDEIRAQLTANQKTTEDLVSFYKVFFNDIPLQTYTLYL